MVVSIRPRATPRRLGEDGEAEREGLGGDPGREIEGWLDKLAEVERMRGGYQEIAARGLITFEALEKLGAEALSYDSMARDVSNYIADFESAWIYATNQETGNHPEAKHGSSRQALTALWIPILGAL